MRTEDERVGRLLNAQANAVALFDEVVARGIIAAGQGEQAVSDRIRDLANEMFGKTRYKRIGQMTVKRSWKPSWQPIAHPVTCAFGRDGRIRTGGLLLPKQAR